VVDELQFAELAYLSVGVSGRGLLSQARRRTGANLRRKNQSQLRHNRTRGFVVKKSRQQQLHLNNCGEYMVVDFNNWVRFGERYDATLEEIDEFLSRQDAA
jgi:hypothetical protein